MIKSFKDKNTQKLNDGQRIKEFQSFTRQAKKRLRILDASDSLDSLKLLPSNRFKSLIGNRQRQYSIRINDQWPICFEWQDDDPINVEIVDYH